MPDKSYVDENNKERERLSNLINRLKPEDLTHPMEAGWTVSAVLAHLAFWDLRASLLIDKWKIEGIETIPWDIDMVNDTTVPFLLAIPPRTAAELAIKFATEIDHKIEQLPDTFVKEIEINGKTVRLNRANHRRGHLDDIEKVLGFRTR